MLVLHQMKPATGEARFTYTLSGLLAQLIAAMYWERLQEAGVALFHPGGAGGPAAVGWGMGSGCGGPHGPDWARDAG